MRLGLVLGYGNAFGGGEPSPPMPFKRCPGVTPTHSHINTQTRSSIVREAYHQRKIETRNVEQRSLFSSFRSAEFHGARNGGQVSWGVRVWAFLGPRPWSKIRVPAKKKDVQISGP